MSENGIGVRHGEDFNSTPLWAVEAESQLRVVVGEKNNQIARLEQELAEAHGRLGHLVLVVSEIRQQLVIASGVVGEIEVKMKGKLIQKANERASKQASKQKGQAT